MADSGYKAQRNGCGTRKSMISGSQNEAFNRLQLLEVVDQAGVESGSLANESTELLASLLYSSTLSPSVSRLSRPAVAHLIHLEGQI
jgi:hypothetical protein